MSIRLMLGGASIVGSTGDARGVTITGCTVNGLRVPDVKADLIADQEVEDGAECARFTIQSDDPLDDIQTSFAIGIALDKAGHVAPGRAARTLMADLHCFVSFEIVDKMEAFFQ
jgi:hypothetical protein